MLTPPDAQMFLTMTKPALALPNLASTSRSVPPCWSTTLPTLVNHACLHVACTCGPPRWPSGKASASRAENPGFESRLRRDFFGVESY